MDDRDVEVLRNACIGRLVSAVAHELNNPVHIVAGNVGFLAQYMEGLLQLAAAMEEGADAARLAQLREKVEYEYLKRDAPRLLLAVREATSRLTTLVKDLRSFTRTAGDLQTLDLVEVVDSALNILAPLFRNRVIVERDTRPPVPKVTAREGHMHQAVLAILAGVAEAVAGGTVTIVIDGVEERARLAVRGPLTRSVIDEFSRRLLEAHGAILEESVGDGVVRVTLAKAT